MTNPLFHGGVSLLTGKARCDAGAGAVDTAYKETDKHNMHTHTSPIHRHTPISTVIALISILLECMERWIKLLLLASLLKNLHQTHKSGSRSCPSFLPHTTLTCRRVVAGVTLMLTLRPLGQSTVTVVAIFLYLDMTVHSSLAFLNRAQKRFTQLPVLLTSHNTHLQESSGRGNFDVDPPAIGTKYSHRCGHLSLSRHDSA